MRAKTSAASTGRSRVREVRLRDLRTLSQELAGRIAADGFRPDCIVYIETGARLLTAELCSELEVGAIPLFAQRRGSRVKGRLVRVLASLPDEVKDRLRTAESRWLSRRLAPAMPMLADNRIELRAARVLILDDAVDTGASIAMARSWVLQRGARADAIKVAALTVTTARARSQVDFHLYEGICRFPWSSDSSERSAYEELYAKTRPPAYSAAGSVPIAT